MGIFSRARRPVETEDNAGESYTIPTRGGIVAVDHPAGEITVMHDGGSFVELLVDDGDGEHVTVFLDYRQAAQLVFAIGAAAVTL